MGFETLDKADALGLETATPLTDPRQYMNSKIAAVVVAKPRGHKNKKVNNSEAKK